MDGAKEVIQNSTELWKVLSIMASLFIFVVGTLISIIGVLVKKNINNFKTFILEFKKEYKEDKKDFKESIANFEANNTRNHKEMQTNINTNTNQIVALQTEVKHFESTLNDHRLIMNDINGHYNTIIRTMERS